MRLHPIHVIVFLSVLGTCPGYKLRRDISKVRYYCKEICKQCGGEAALSQDVCICNIEEAESEEVRHCLERAQNKFDFLGIKLETDNRPVNKRSIYKNHQPTYPDYQRDHIFVKPNQKESLNDGDTSGPDDKLRLKRSFNDYGSRLDITRFSEMFRPEENNPFRPPTNFKILLGSSKRPDSGRGSYYDMTTLQERSDDEDCSEDEDNSSDNSDYTDGQIALGDELDLRRLGNHETNMYELIPPPDHARLDDSTIEQFHSIWDSVLYELLNPNYFIPTNFADNIVL